MCVYICIYVAIHIHTHTYIYTYITYESNGTNSACPAEVQTMVIDGSLDPDAVDALGVLVMW
jgi:hypothetical protein